MKIKATDRNGNSKELEGRDGWTLMEILRDGGLDITAECGGACACATCHVYVDQAWWPKVGEPDDIEFAMLDMVADVMKDTSRLGCQIKMKPELDGLEVTVAPASSY